MAGCGWYATRGITKGAFQTQSCLQALGCLTTLIRLRTVNMRLRPDRQLLDMTIKLTSLETLRLPTVDDPSLLSTLRGGVVKYTCCHDA